MRDNFGVHCELQSDLAVIDVPFCPGSRPYNRNDSPKCFHFLLDRAMPVQKLEVAGKSLE
jgi:hypothetical protein